MGCPISIELADRHTDRVEGVVLVAPAGGINNQPLRRAVKQLAIDGVRESPRMAKVAVPDYLRFGPINTLRLFSEMTRFPALERLLRDPGPDARRARQPRPAAARRGARAARWPRRSPATSPSP